MWPISPRREEPEDPPTLSFGRGDDAFVREETTGVREAFQLMEAAVLESQPRALREDPCGFRNEDRAGAREAALSGARHDQWLTPITSNTNLSSPRWYGLHRGDSRHDYESLPGSSSRSEKSVESPASQSPASPAGWDAG